MHENSEDTRAAEADARSTLDELEGRRVKVTTLRLRGLTQEAMAQALGVDQSTISRDIAWIRNHRRELFGDHSTFDSAQEIGEAVALFADVEMSALRDFSRLKPDQSRARIACLRTAMMARQMRVNLLRDLGFLDRPIGNVGMAIRTDAVRQALIEEGLILPDGRAIAAEVTPADDEVEQWLRQAGRHEHSVGARSCPEGSVEGMQTERETNEPVTP